MISKSNVELTDSNVKFVDSEVNGFSIRFIDNAFVIIFFKTMYNKTIIRFGFCDIRNNQGLG